MKLLSLETDRFLLRPLTSEDEGLYVELYTSPEVMLHVTEPLDFSSASQAFGRVEALNRRESGEYLTWVVSCRSDGQRIGLLALISCGDLSEIGALIFPKWHNGGVATEIIRCLMDHAFMNGESRAVFTRHRAANAGAEGLMRKLDFQRIPAEGDLDGGVRWERTRGRWQQGRDGERAARKPD